MPSPRVPTARTLANRAKRVQMDYAALGQMQMGMADALMGLGLRIILDAEAHAPRDPEAAAARGVPMMAETGGFQVWAGGKRVGGVWEKRPKGGSAPADQAVLFVGFGSPISHLVELGTVKMIARPFLTPALNRNIADIGPYVQAGMAARLASADARADVGYAIQTGNKAALRPAQAAVRKIERRVMKVPLA